MQWLAGSVRLFMRLNACRVNPQTARPWMGVCGASVGGEGALPKRRAVTFQGGGSGPRGVMELRGLRMAEGDD
jgi:hypothetical protein